MRILVFGGRDYLNYENIRDAIEDLFCGTWIEKEDKAIKIFLAKAFHYTKLEDHKRVNYTDYPVDWEKYGKAAGPIRNQQMIDKGKPDLVVAFPGETK